MICEDTLSLCVTGLLTAIGALVWTIKQQKEINTIKSSLNNG